MRTIIPRHHNPALYTGFEARRTLRRSVTRWASWGLEYQLSALRCMRMLGNPFTGRGENWLSAMLTMNERLGRDYHKPHFGIDDVTTPEGTVSVTEEMICDKPFASLLRFRRNSQRKDPKVLVVAPMSGHYSTLLRDTVQTLLKDHDVYITDWHNARDISTDEGTFGFDHYVQYIVDFLNELGPETHLLAVCQPTVPALVATAHMEEVDHPCRPASLTVMGGPID
ncbi:MAG TPA: polyhydroxyalkanoate depolymerase, partial [Phycisphaerales bacterium]|nr:polyhydroxyalkanoate depolymerase [Phycisphaerales bacterium]